MEARTCSAPPCGAGAPQWSAEAGPHDAYHRAARGTAGQSVQRQLATADDEEALERVCEERFGPRIRRGRLWTEGQGLADKEGAAGRSEYENRKSGNAVILIDSA